MIDPEALAREEMSEEMAALHTRLDAARAQREAAAEASKPSELVAFRMRVEAEERAARNEAALAAAVAKHGAVGVQIDVVEVPDGRIVIVRRPHAALYKAFQDLDKVTFEEAEKLVRPCVEYPDKGEYDAITDAYPGVVNSGSIKVCGLAGMRRAELKGK